jgi:uncharacterized protein (TIGR00290 family)
VVGVNVKQKILLAWSGGKDSALALYEIIRTREYDVAALLTTVTEGYDRVSMHSVRRTLLEQQVNSLGFPFEEVRIPEEASSEAYGSKMRQVLEKYLEQGVQSVAFGDVFLEDVRVYREKNLARVGMKAVFPLWGRDSRDLVVDFMDAGFKAVVTCVDTAVLGKEFAGREIDEEFLRALPPTVDPCGENGEYHSFVYDGPILRERVAYRRGETALRDGRFFYCDLLPSEPCVLGDIS